MTNTSSSQALYEFLQWEHAKQYTGTDDDMPDSCDHWIDELTDEQVAAMAVSVYRQGGFPFSTIHE
jgi:hypothetical protein